ncbi:MAG: tetratricopeptide repeat protein [Segniliparus sp.]|uniref:tetratricopeptide repeat protein n=1 Tax=Segniliparus sp. TaxID=2804064 RepID=UPI003F3056D6
MDAPWQQRIDALWDAFDDYEPDGFLAAVALLVAELPDGDPVGLFELGGAHDSTGHERQAAECYRRALAGGLDSPRRRQAVVQLASTLRNLGEPAAGAELLRAELGRPAEDEDTAALHDCAVAFLALCLADLGQEREGLGLALTALAGRLPRYRRSLANYAAGL